MGRVCGVRWLKQLTGETEPNAMVSTGKTTWLGKLGFSIVSLAWRLKSEASSNPTMNSPSANLIELSAPIISPPRPSPYGADAHSAMLPGESPGSQAHQPPSRAPSHSDTSTPVPVDAGAETASARSPTPSRSTGTGLAIRTDTAPTASASRRTHAKSRTGCRTCKRRKVKVCH